MECPTLGAGWLTGTTSDSSAVAFSSGTDRSCRSGSHTNPAGLSPGNSGQRPGANTQAVASLAKPFADATFAGGPYPHFSDCLRSVGPLRSYVGDVRGVARARRATR